MGANSLVLSWISYSGHAEGPENEGDLGFSSSFLAFDNPTLLRSQMLKT